MPAALKYQGDGDCVRVLTNLKVGRPSSSSKWSSTHNSSSTARSTAVPSERRHRGDRSGAAVDRMARRERHGGLSARRDRRLLRCSFPVERTDEGRLLATGALSGGIEGFAAWRESGSGVPLPHEATALIRVFSAVRATGTNQGLDLRVSDIRNAISDLGPVPAVVGTWRRLGAVLCNVVDGRQGSFELLITPRGRRPRPGTGVSARDDSSRQQRLGRPPRRPRAATRASRPIVSSRGQYRRRV